MALLEAIQGPRDLDKLSSEQLTELATEIRAYLIPTVAKTSGHIGPNLGVVELTIALHRVFESPKDTILWDVGHQAYVHKLLTGRKDFSELRHSGGLSGYPARAESEHDVIENSHASTALAYADGLAKAFELDGATARHAVAVIGDGALTGGLAWEALTSISAAPHRPLVIVFNDNGRSYDRTVGSLADTGSYEAFFTSLGLPCLGPVDGHDASALEAALREARSRGCTVVVHCQTEKGRGYAPAERDEADRMHGIGVLDPRTGRPASLESPSWTSVFAQAIVEVGRRRPDVVGLTAAMRQPVGLDGFAREFPQRFFDVGIAEQQAVCSAAGLAMGGRHPVVCLYATFLNRAFDQVVMDVALHRLPVTFVLDRAGITGPDGSSHHGMWDLALLGMVPGLRLAAPRDPAGLRSLLDEAVDHQGPSVLRFPKASAGPDIEALSRFDGLDVLHRTKNTDLDVLLVSAGVMAQPCLRAAALLEREGIGVTVVDPRWLFPVSPALANLVARHKAAVTVEDGIVHGGFGSRLAQVCVEAGIRTPVRALGLPADFAPHGDRARLLALAGLDEASIVSAAQSAVSGAAAPFLPETSPSGPMTWSAR